jgi:hypothetical protein
MIVREDLTRDKSVQKVPQADVRNEQGAWHKQFKRRERPPITGMHDELITAAQKSILTILCGRR